MIKWFDRCGVEFSKSDMSLSVSVDRGRTAEWGSNSLHSLFAQKSNLLNYKFHRFVYELNSFGPDVLKWLSEQEKKMTKMTGGGGGGSGTGPDLKLSCGEWLTSHNYSQYFIDWYLIPVVSVLRPSEHRSFDRSIDLSF